MSSGTPTVSILIVNWNSKDLLRQCLISIRETCADLATQVVVVENGSFDGCAELIAAEFPEVDFIQSPDNIGFGCANNLGLASVTGDAVWVLNPDTEVMPGALQTLLDELETRPDAGIVSPKQLNTDLTLQTSVHALPTPSSCVGRCRHTGSGRRQETSTLRRPLQSRPSPGPRC